MRYSRAFIPTLREAPADAEVVSHVLLARGGYLRKLAAGIYDLLPLGWRVVRKVEEIVREEMNRAGAQEVLLPAAVPAELWQESGRWQKYGPELLRFKDRKGADFCIGPTHEEVIVGPTAGAAATCAASSAAGEGGRAIVASSREAPSSGQML